MDGIDVQVDQRQRTRTEVILVMMINSQCVVDRREQFARTDFAILHTLAVFIGRAIDGSTLHAATGKRRTPGTGAG